MSSRRPDETRRSQWGEGSFDNGSARSESSVAIPTGPDSLSGKTTRWPATVTDATACQRGSGPASATHAAPAHDGSTAPTKDLPGPSAVHHWGATSARSITTDRAGP